MKIEIKKLLHGAECLAVDLRNAANGYGVGNLESKANLAEHIQRELEILSKWVPDLISLAEEFCRRAESGEIKSRDTYRKFKEVIAKATEKP